MKLVKTARYVRGTIIHLQQPSKKRDEGRGRPAHGKGKSEKSPRKIEKRLLALVKSVASQEVSRYAKMDRVNKR